MYVLRYIYIYIYIHIHIHICLVSLHSAKGGVVETRCSLFRLAFEFPESDRHWSCSSSRLAVVCVHRLPNGVRTNGVFAEGPSILIDLPYLCSCRISHSVSVLLVAPPVPAVNAPPIHCAPFCRVSSICIYTYIYIYMI